MAVMGKVTDVVDLPMGVAETKHQPATLVKFASGSHTFIDNDEFQKQKPYIDWYSREENTDVN